jgi:hypothetical protein
MAVCSKKKEKISIFKERNQRYKGVQIKAVGEKIQKVLDNPN